MNKLLTGAGLTIVVASIASIAPTTASYAQSISPNGESISPKKLPRNFGLVRSYSGDTLELQGFDGSQQTYKVPSDVTSPENLQPGDIVGYDYNKKGQLVRLAASEPADSYEGTIQAIDGNQVTVELPNGEVRTTTIEPSTISRMSLEPGSGQVLRVTQYQGTAATKVCVGKPIPIVESPPAPVGAPELPPPAPEPIPALW